MKELIFPTVLTSAIGYGFWYLNASVYLKPYSRGVMLLLREELINSHELQMKASSSYLESTDLAIVLLLLLFSKFTSCIQINHNYIVNKKVKDC